MSLANWQPTTKWHSKDAIPVTNTLYELEGPAIFASRIGLEVYVFFKVAPRAKSDVFLVARTNPSELAALESGRLSVRGILDKEENWLMELDLDHRVLGFDRGKSQEFAQFLPPKQLALYSHFKRASDYFIAADSPLIFKFAGDALGSASIPLSVFKGLVENVYEAVRRAIVPPSLSAGRSIELLNFPVRPLAFKSLMIPLGHPVIDTELLRRRSSTRNLNPEVLVQEAEFEGAKFAEQVERTVEQAASGKITKTFARDYRSTLESIFEILPNENTDFSSLFFSSDLDGQHFAASVDREVGDRLYETYKSIRTDSKEVTGVIVGQTQRSNRLLVRNRNGREITVYLVPSIYESMLVNGDLFIGQRIQVSGSLQKRPDRDLLKADGRPNIL